MNVRAGNVLTLNDTHHCLVHEGGFTIERHRDGRFYFGRPDGRPVENARATDRIEEERPLYLVQVHSAEWGVDAIGSRSAAPGDGIGRICHRQGGTNRALEHPSA